MEPCDQSNLVASDQFESCLGTSTRKLGRFISQVFDDELRPFGLRGTQVSVLVTLDGLGPSPAARLAESLHADQSTISRAVRRLSQLGLVSDCECPGDARAVLLSLSDDGRALLEKAHPAWQRAQARVRETLGPSLSEALLDASGRVPA